MKVYESERGMYRFSYLPSFAQYVFDHHLDAFVTEQIRLSYELNIPVLRHLAHFTPEQLFAQIKGGNVELLQHLAGNRAKEFVALSMQRWLSDQLPMINKSRSRPRTLPSSITSGRKR